MAARVAITKSQLLGLIWLLTGSALASSVLAGSVLAQDSPAQIWADRTATGIAAAASGRQSEALTLLRSALLAAEALGADDPRLATAKSNLALQRLAGGDIEGAGPLLQEALELRERVLGLDHRRVADAHVDLAIWHEAQGDAPSAELAYGKALAIREALLGPADPASLALLDRLMHLATKNNRYGEAIRIGRRALISDTTTDQTAAIQRRLQLANLLNQTERFDEAETVLNDALQIEQSPALHFALANSLKVQGKFEQALEALGEDDRSALLRAEILANTDVDTAKTELADLTERFDEDHPLRPRLELTRAKIARSEDETDQAVSLVNTLIDQANQAPSSNLALLSDAFFLRASLYREQGQLNLAITDLLTTLKLEQTHTGNSVAALQPTLKALAETQQAAGMFPEAQATRAQLEALAQ